ncbi:MAG: aldo/keto reductase [Solirubrobacterales bacterium]|nr:aldo/keto reductase [Solirubrobacterales bacterium]MCO5327902.1 aldo/keto reductase [Solirubrobacterales bacterium]
MSSPTTPLPTRRIGDPGGDRGLDVSLVGLGCNNFGRRLDLEGTRDVLDAALDAGITLFDTADIYGGGGASETLMGEALEGRRDRFVLTTKFGMEMRGINGVPGVPRGSAEYIRWAVEGSLRRLRTDFIDLYQYHQPDGVTPMAETLEAMSELVDEGKVGFIGCSNFSAAQLEEAESVARERGIARFVTLQNEYSLLEREIEAEVQPTCERLGVGILPFFPLASGLLSGKYRRGAGAPEGTRLHGRDSVATDAQFNVIEALTEFAHARGIELLDVAIAGLAAQPAIASVIAGATKPEQVEANVAALRWEPTAADLAELDRIAPTPR